MAGEGEDLIVDGGEGAEGAAAAAETADKAGANTADDDAALAKELDSKGVMGSNKDDAGSLSDDGNGDGEGGVPETYTFEPPEGFEVTPEFQAGLDQFNPVAKELGMSQEQYDGLVKFEIERSKQQEQQFLEAWGGRVDEWRSTAKSDKEMSQDQPFTQTLQQSQAALKQFGTPGLRAFLRSPSPENPDGLAVGNHPEMLRFLSRVGKAIADPSLLTGDVTDAADDAGLRRMYPSMFDKTP